MRNYDKAKNILVLLFQTSAFLFPCLSSAKVQIFDEVVPETSVKISTDRQKKNSEFAMQTASGPSINFRIFPINAFASQIHLGAEFLITKNVALGAEIAYQPNAYSGFLGDRFYLSQESYAGLLGQYYFSEGMKGFFVEAGVNYMSASVIGSLNGDSADSWSNGYFWMPHVSLNYRVRPSWVPVTMSFGVGGFQLVGPALKYQRTVYTLSAPPTFETKDSEYDGGSHLRIRFDLGYAF